MTNKTWQLVGNKVREGNFKTSEIFTHEEILAKLNMSLLDIEIIDNSEIQ